MTSGALHIAVFCDLCDPVSRILYVFTSSRIYQREQLHILSQNLTDLSTIGMPVEYAISVHFFYAQIRMLLYQIF